MNEFCDIPESYSGNKKCQFNSPVFNVYAGTMWGYFKVKVGYFTFPSTARVTLGQVISIVTCGTRTHTEVTAYDWMPNLLTTRPLRTSNGLPWQRFRLWECSLANTI